MATYTFLAIRIDAGAGSDFDLKFGEGLGLDSWAEARQDLGMLTAAGVAITATFYIGADLIALMLGTTEEELGIEGKLDYAYALAFFLVTYPLAFFTCRHLLLAHRERKASKRWLRSFSKLERDKPTDGWSHNIDR